MDFANIDEYLRNLEVEENFSFGFSFNSTRNLPQNETTERSVPVHEHKRPLPYIKNFLETPVEKPTMAGIHYSQRSGLGFTLRFPDGLFYSLSPSYKKKGVLPLNKEGILFTRCFKGNRKCKAKSRLKYLKDISHLMDIEANREDILNPDNWEIVAHKDLTHSCGCPCKSYNSDRENFSYEYQQCRLTLMDSDGKVSWESCFARWESGLGLDFDGLVLGNKDDHAQRFYTTKKRKAPTSNLNAVNAKELVFDEDLKKMSYTICDEMGIPRQNKQDWYRGYDDNGKFYLKTFDPSDCFFIFSNIRTIDCPVK